MKILIVDDDPEMGELIERGLQAEGYETVLVADGVAALVAIREQQFALAAIDVMMPGMSGFEVCRHIRNAGLTMPVLLLTARQAVEDRVYGLDAGADDYLTKPFAFVELSARVRALLRRDTQPERRTFTIGPLTLDGVALSVRSSGGGVIPMSPREFSLLTLFGREPGTLISRTRILDEIWGTTENIDPNIVDQYVSYLRRKLEPYDTLHIVTKRGAGYLLEVDA